MMYAHCWRSGEIELHENKILVPGMICIGRGEEEDLKARLSARARLAYDGETWLVPGVPEADNDDDAQRAAFEFKIRMNKPLAA